jgi:chromate transporter
MLARDPPPTLERVARTSLRELSLLFLRLGSTAFGGPAAHIAMMRDEVVRRRAWLSEEQFLDLLGATNLIPGPNSTELAIHIGWQRRRWLGLIVAGTAFISPAALISAALGWAYLRCGALPSAGWLLYGVKPVILAVVLQAIWGLAGKALGTPVLRWLAAGGALMAALGVHELAILFGAGIVAALYEHLLRGRGGAAPPSSRDSVACFTPLLQALPPAAGAALASTATLPALFLVFLKIGSVLFGSGYVLLAFLRADLVERLGWLSETQLIDAVAVGQITPGPVFTTATFIGYLLAGPAGAAVATLGIFLPAFVFVALSGPLIPRLRASPAAGAFLDGVNAASLALMAVVTVQLAHSAFVDVPAVLLGAVSALLLVRFRLNSSWLVLGGALSGWLIQSLR